MKKILNYGILPFVSVWLAWYLYKTYFNDWLHFYLRKMVAAYPIIGLAAILSTALIFYFTALQLAKGKMDHKLLVSSYLIYFTILIFLLFGKANNVQGFSTDTFGFFDNFVAGNLRVITIGNILAFIPIGFLLYPLSFISTLFLATAGVTLIESLQYFLKVGFFDTGDIFLNVTGIMIGYCFIRVSQKWISI